MPKGRRTNNRHKRKRLPPWFDPGRGKEAKSRGTQGGGLRRRKRVKK